MKVNYTKRQMMLVLMVMVVVVGSLTKANLKRSQNDFTRDELQVTFNVVGEVGYKKGSCLVNSRQ